MSHEVPESLQVASKAIQRIPGSLSRVSGVNALILWSSRGFKGGSVGFIWLHDRVSGAIAGDLRIASGGLGGLRGVSRGLKGFQGLFSVSQELSRIY